MSGIVGIWNFDGRPIERSELATLSATLAHRGPDGDGLEVRGAVGLACRLARTMPEAADESQPVIDPAGVMLVFDGRLDNRDELLSGMSQAGLSADCPDSVLALAAYRRYGDAFPERLNGDFAIGLFDPRRRTMLLARDAIGLRPLYYCASRAGFLFASEIKTLLAHPDIPARPADDVLADFLFNRLSADDERGLTFFQNIYSLLPAHLAIVTPDAVVTRRYWDFDPSRQIRFRSFPEYAEAFRHHFDRAVGRRLRSAGSVAVSVSGGLDSSAIFCVGEMLRRTAPKRYPRLLGISYTAPDGAPSDEKAFLAEIERKYGLEIERCPDLPSGILDGSQEAIWHAEAPFLDTQWSRTNAFFASVRKRGARVLLTGHWGDQFLFDDAYLVDLCRRGAWRTAWRHLNEFVRWQDISDRSFYKRRLVKALLKGVLPDQIVLMLRRLLANVRGTRDVQPWFTADFRRRADTRTDTSGGWRQGSSSHVRSLYREARCRYHVLCMEWNNKVGAMHGLEMAFPFLDRDLIAFLLATPGEMHAFGGIPKAILRQALRGVLPEAIAGRRSKADFTSVVNDGISQDYDRLVDCIRGESLAASMGYIGQDVLNEQLTRPIAQEQTCSVSWALGDLLAFELWLQRFSVRTI